MKMMLSNFYYLFVSARDKNPAEVGMDIIPMYEAGVK